ncbi:MAG: hypothetical protein ACFB15_12390 [Cyclobacteriaceae bacterium]
MDNKNISFIILVLATTLFGYGQTNNHLRGKKGINDNLDTLDIGYTYWWSDSGPFIGLCGENYSLVFLGIVRDINSPMKDTTLLYTSQEGIIEITETIKARRLQKENYNSHKYFSSDCFYNSDVNGGDTVMVFCYEYEGSYSIPGPKSIMKIDGFDDPTVRSIRKYIQMGENPITLKEDMDLWKSKGLENKLKQIIECREETHDHE